MQEVHRIIAGLRPWQAFIVSGSIILCVGYVLHLFEERWHGFKFAFNESDMPSVPFYLTWGLWLDTVAVTSKQGPKRWLAPVLLTLLATGPFVLPQLPGGFAAVGFALAIAFIAFVAVPTTRALQRMNKEGPVQFPLFLETAMLFFFPFCLWLFQPRLHKAGKQQGAPRT